MGAFPGPGGGGSEWVARRYYALVTARNGQRPGESSLAWKARIADSDRQLRKAGAELSSLILAPAEPRLGDRPLLVVAEGALQYIPFSALPLATSGSPLVSRHEIVILPSATALAPLRRELKGRPLAPYELAIFADPVFHPNDPRLKLPLGPLGEKAQPASALQPAGLRSAPEVEAGRDSEIDVTDLPRLA